MLVTVELCGPLAKTLAVPCGWLDDPGTGPDARPHPTVPIRIARSCRNSRHDLSWRCRCVDLCVPALVALLILNARMHGCVNLQLIG